MRIEQLMCFLEVVMTGSISGAAQNLHISQQSASQSIKQLELELGCDLLTRGKHGVGVTEYGKEVAITAKRILKEHEALQDKINQMKVNNVLPQEVSFRIVSTSSIINSVLPHIISNMDAKASVFHVSLSMGNDVNDVVNHVQKGDCDIGFITYSESALLNELELLHTDLQLDVLERDEIVAVLDKKYYKGNYKYLYSEELKQHRVTVYNILPSKNSESYLGDMNHIIYSNDVDFHRKMLHTGAVVVMPKLSYNKLFQTKNIIALPVENVMESLVHAVLYKNNNDLNLKGFAGLIRKELHTKY